MKSVTLQSKPDKIVEPLQKTGGQEAESFLNTAIVGGGVACYNLLKTMDNDRLSRLRMKILGVSDINPEAPGFCYAKELNLFTTTTFEELFALKGLNMILELTGSMEVKEKLITSKPPDISLIDHIGVRLLWDLIQMEMEKTELENEHLMYQEKEKKHTQVILDSLPYRIMVINMDMTIDTVNQTFLREFNQTRDNVQGKHCYEIRNGLDQPCKENGRTCFLKDRLEEITEKGFISSYNKYKDEDGNTRFDVITIAPIFDKEGEIVQILEASRDVTDRFKLEEEVRKSHTFIQNVIQSTVDGIVVVDTKGNILIFNEGMERLTGYSAQKIEHLTSFYDIDTAKENMKKMRSKQYGPLGKLNPTSMTVTTKDGEVIPVTLSASIITIDGEDIGSVGIFTDMREIVQMRKELEDTHLQLVQSDKIASVGRMAAGVAHEINNPLAGILIYSELLKESLYKNTQHLNDIQEIIDQTLRCKKIVSELLEFSRQSVGKVSSFNLDDLIDKSLNLLINQAIFQNIKVSKTIGPDLPRMVGDMGQLQQVFTNLFINAADAMEGKGRLHIQAQFDPDTNLYSIEVSDNGPGIPIEIQDQVFDIFFTTKQVGKGTGLGLSISQNIIALHGGNIRVDCPPEKGTTFTIELPLGFVEHPVQEPIFIGLEND